MSASAETNTLSADRPASFQPQAGIGLPIAVGTFGFSVLMLGIPNAGLITGAAATIFIAVAFGTGAFGLFIGGLMEYRANNIFGGTFALFYSAFLLTTAIMLRVFAKEMEGPGLCRRIRHLAAPVVRVHVHAFLGRLAYQHAGVSRLRAPRAGLPVVRIGQSIRIAGDGCGSRHNRRLGPHRRRFGCLVSELGARGQSGDRRQAAVVAVSLRCVLASVDIVGVRTWLAPHRPGAWTPINHLVTGGRPAARGEGRAAGGDYSLNLTFGDLELAVGRAARGELDPRLHLGCSQPCGAS